jgi:hypothetical protein
LLHAQHSEQQQSQRSGYSIAVALLARLAGDTTLKESVPDTLELLLRACLEALQLALRRAPAQRTATTSTTATATDNAEVAAARAVLAAALSVCAAASTDTITTSTATDTVNAASSESQLQHNWLLETVARVARKMEHEWHSLLFPLHFAALNSTTAATTADSDELEAAYPTHLFHASLVQNKLITAAWFLPLIE